MAQSSFGVDVHSALSAPQVKARTVVSKTETPVINEASTVSTVETSPVRIDNKASVAITNKDVATRVIKTNKKHLAVAGLVTSVAVSKFTPSVAKVSLPAKGMSGNVRIGVILLLIGLVFIIFGLFIPIIGFIGLLLFLVGLVFLIIGLING